MSQFTEAGPHSPSWTGLTEAWIGVGVDKAGPQWQGAELWMCWKRRSGVLTGGSTGRGAMAQSGALGPMGQVESRTEIQSQGPTAEVN